MTWNTFKRCNYKIHKMKWNITFFQPSTPFSKPPIQRALFSQDNNYGTLRDQSSLIMFSQYTLSHSSMDFNCAKPFSLQELNNTLEIFIKQSLSINKSGTLSILVGMYLKSSDRHIGMALHTRQWLRWECVVPYWASLPHIARITVLQHDWRSLV